MSADPSFRDEIPRSLGAPASDASLAFPGAGDARPCVSNRVRLFLSVQAGGAQLRRIKEQILEFDWLIGAWHRSNEMSMRLDGAPGVGPVLATACLVGSEMCIRDSNDP